MHAGGKKGRKRKNEAMEHPGKWQFWHEQPSEDKHHRGCSSSEGGMETTPPNSAEGMLTSIQVLLVALSEDSFWQLSCNVSSPSCHPSPQMHEQGCGSARPGLCPSRTGPQLFMDAVREPASHSSLFIRHFPSLNRRAVIPVSHASSAVTTVNRPTGAGTSLSLA